MPSNCRPIRPWLRHSRGPATAAPVASQPNATSTRCGVSVILGNHDEGKKTFTSTITIAERKYWSIADHMSSLSWAKVPMNTRNVANANSTTVNRKDAGTEASCRRIFDGSLRSAVVVVAAAEPGCSGAVSTVAINGSLCG